MSSAFGRTLLPPVLIPIITQQDIQRSLEAMAQPLNPGTAE